MIQLKLSIANLKSLAHQLIPLSKKENFSLVVLFKTMWLATLAA